jgi:deoxyribonucleoside regulator
MDQSHSREVLVKVATMYYLGNQPQDEIAKKLDFSRSKVSRLLGLARKLKVIEFNINQAPSAREDWAIRLKNHFGLKEVIIAPSASNILDSKKNIGRAAAKYLEDIIVNDIYIGLAWGTTISQIVKQFAPVKKVSNAWVIQLNGGTNVDSDSFRMDGTELVKTFARKINAYNSILPTQFIVNNRLLKKLLVEEDEIRLHMEKFKKLDIAIVGLNSNSPEECVAYKSGYITLQESRELIESGFVASICGNRINQEGAEKDNILTGRVLSIDLPTLKQVPIVIGVGEGERKTAATISTIKGGFINALVIDELLALSIMNSQKIT